MSLDIDLRWIGQDRSKLEHVLVADAGRRREAPDAGGVEAPSLPSGFDLGASGSEAPLAPIMQHINQKGT